MASSHHFTHPRQVSARLAPPLWCAVPLLLSIGSPFALSSFFAFLSFVCFTFFMFIFCFPPLFARYVWFLFRSVFFRYSLFSAYLAGVPMLCLKYPLRWHGTLRCLIMYSPCEYCMTMYYLLCRSLWPQSLYPCRVCWMSLSRRTV